MSKKKYADWAEKYRPRTIDEVVGNPTIIADFKRFIANQNFPNILAIGTPGIGKTTCMRLLVKAIMLPCLEINASLDSGIHIIREDVYDYAHQMDIDGAPFKVVIFDQVDRLTKDAQQASLQLAEEVSAYCKFLATTNDVRHLHEAFIDRFKVYRFQPIDEGDTVKRLKYICRKEHIKVDAELLYIIAKASRGSLRMSIKTLQAAGEGKDELRRDDVNAWTWVPPYGKINKSIKLAMKGKFTESIKVVNDILRKTTVRWFFVGVQDQLFKGKKYTDIQRETICAVLPQGNPHSMVDQDIFRFLAMISREFNE